MAAPLPSDAVESSALQSPAESPSLRFAALQRLMAADMAQVDQFIRAHLASDVLLVNQIAHHITASGGKRLRPLLTLLSARAAGYAGSQHCQAAAVVEFIHTATLLHDDVVDESHQRRGQRTAHTVWGNAASILVGDFLYSRAFQLMVGLDSMPVMRLMADTTNAIAEGEVLQLMHLNNPDVQEAAYRNVIERKTAVLFASATQLGALLAHRGEREVRALADYGLHLGLAFQMVDDVLDYDAQPGALGKDLGDDLAEGKVTLPLIYAMQRADTEAQRLIRHAVETGDRTQMPAILEVLRRTQAIESAKAQATQHARQARAAIDPMPQSPYKNALLDLADYAVERHH